MQMRKIDAKKENFFLCLFVGYKLKIYKGTHQSQIGVKLGYHCK